MSNLRANFCLNFDCRKLAKSILNLEKKLAAATAGDESTSNGSHIAMKVKNAEPTTKRKHLVVVGVNTAFTSRKRRDSVRATWMPQGMP